LGAYEQIPGQVTLTHIAEDLGSQQNLMFAPAHMRKYMLSGMKRMIDLAYQAGAFVFHHDDGNCRRMLPELIEVGINILNPIQWCYKGMDREELKRDLGNRLIFHGAVDNQQTLPFGTAADVRKGVLDNIRILGKGSGYILAIMSSQILHLRMLLPFLKADLKMAGRRVPGPMAAI